MFPALKSASLSPGSSYSLTPAISTEPAVGWFIPPSTDRRVLFPEPDCPMMVTNSPASMERFTPASASTVSSPLTYCFFRFSILIKDIFSPLQPIKPLHQPSVFMLQRSQRLRRVHPAGMQRRIKAGQQPDHYGESDRPEGYRHIPDKKRIFPFRHERQGQPRRSHARGKPDKTGQQAHQQRFQEDDPHDVALSEADGAENPDLGGPF